MVNFEIINQLYNTGFMKKPQSIILKILVSIVFMFVLQTINGNSLKVLFLGNSHTFFNDLPQLTYELALSNGDTIVFESSTPSGCTFGHPENGHLYNSASLALIDSLDWDYVILQEHSLFAVIDYYRETFMYPGARSLDSLIKLNNECTETIVQLIWGKKNGGEHCIGSNCTIDFDDFAHMQDSLTMEYLRLADSLSFTVAPAGEAWKHVIQNSDAIELFYQDESHPSLAGSYLNACVYYAVIFQKSPVGLTFTAGLESSTALLLQQAADEIVFGNPLLWNINGNIPVAGFEMMQIDNMVICTDTSENADFYLWDFGDGTMDTLQNPVHTYTFPGTFVITQEASTLCQIDIATDTVVVDIINSSIPKNAGHDIKIVKGASPSIFNLTSGSSKMYQIDMYGLEGQLVYSEKLKNNHKHLINMRFLPAGLYILVIYTADGAKTFKIPYSG